MLYLTPGRLDWLIGKSVLVYVPGVLVVLQFTILHFIFGRPPGILQKSRGIKEQVQAGSVLIDKWTIPTYPLL